tara:strand:+ start:1905 stop:3212 length:1308 start_codon:yes stop_codon:yes gene_type:complete
MRKTFSQLFPDAVHGPFSKRKGEKGPQELMHLRYEELGRPELRFIAEDVNKKAIKRYWLMTAKALEKIIDINKKDKRNNCFYEIMPSPDCTYRHSCKACEQKLAHFGTRAYLDLEFPDPCDFDSFVTSVSDYATLGEEIADCFATFLHHQYNCSAEARIMKSHRAGKYSWHVVYDCRRDGKEILFRNSLTLLTAMKEFFKQGHAAPYLYFDANEAGETVEKNVIDDSVYSTHKLYRTLHSQKYGRLTGSFVVEKGPRDFREHLVLQRLAGDSPLFFELEEAESTTKINKIGKRKKVAGQGTGGAPKRRRELVAPEAQRIMESLSLWKATFRFLLKKFPSLEMHKVQVKSLLRVYVPLDREHRCPMKRGSGPEGAHRNNHSSLMFFPADAAVYWRCQKRECKELGASVRVPLPLSLKHQWQGLYHQKRCLVIAASS